MFFSIFNILSCPFFLLVTLRWSSLIKRVLTEQKAGPHFGQSRFCIRFDWWQRELARAIYAWTKWRWHCGIGDTVCVFMHFCIGDPDFRLWLGKASIMLTGLTAALRRASRQALRQARSMR